MVPLYFSVLIDMETERGPYCWKCGEQLTEEPGLEPYCPKFCPPRCTKCGTEEVMAPALGYYCPKGCIVGLEALFHRYKLMSPEPETQETVWQWAYDTFPDYRSREARAMALIEEAIEVGIAAGLSLKQIQSAVDLPIKKLAEMTADQPMESDRAELADVLSCVYAYAGQGDFNVHQELNQKMAKNRARPREFYAQKTAKKRELGFVLPTKEEA